MKPMVSGLQSGTHNRRSDPTSLHPWSSAVTGGGDLERIDSKEELITSGTFSSSLDNLARMRNSREKSNNISPPTKNVKPVDPPKLKLRKSICRNAAWAVDSSWEFIGKFIRDYNKIIYSCFPLMRVYMMKSSILCMFELTKFKIKICSYA